MNEYIGAIGFGGFMIGFLLGFFLNESIHHRGHDAPDVVADPKQMAEPTELNLPTELTAHVVFHPLKPPEDLPHEMTNIYCGGCESGPICQSCYQPWPCTTKQETL